MDRRTKLQWMKDILDRLDWCHEQWETGDPRTETFLVDTIERDLNEFRRLCHSLRRDEMMAAGAYG